MQKMYDRIQTELADFATEFENLKRIHDPQLQLEKEYLSHRNASLEQEIAETRKKLESGMPLFANTIPLAELLKR